MPRSQKPRNVRLRLAINGMRGAVTLPAVMVEGPKGKAGDATVEWVHPLTKKRMTSLVAKAKDGSQGWLEPVIKQTLPADPKEPEGTGASGQGQEGADPKA